MLQVLEGPFINRGELLSEPLDCGAGQMVRITMPADWTEAGLTFQISTDGVFFNDLFGLDGYEVAIDNVVPGSAVLIPEGIGRAIAFVRFRSGTRANPVEQEADRAFAVAIRTEAPAGLGFRGA